MPADPGAAREQLPCCDIRVAYLTLNFLSCLPPTDQPPSPGGKSTYAPGTAAKITSVSTGNLCAEVWTMRRPTWVSQSACVLQENFPVVVAPERLGFKVLRQWVNQL